MRQPFALLAALALMACKDGDGDGRAAGKDCDDSHAGIYPGATEICDGKDNDCNGQIDEGVSFVAWQDRDGDGFGDPDRGRRVCKLPEDGVTNDDDCDDLDVAAFPGSAEVCDGRDDDCDGEIDEGVQTTFYLDADGDGYGAAGAASTIGGCTVPSGYARQLGDCDDADPLAWTDRVEVCDGADNDCDGEVDEGLPLIDLYADADGDGHGTDARVVAVCGPLAGASVDALDCDDADAAHGPDTPESDLTPGDDDCDGYVNELEVPTAYATVATAMAVAAPGDVVQVVGLVEEDVELDDDITLAGEGCGRSVLAGTATGPVVLARRGRVADLTITGGAAGGLRTEGDVTASRVCVEANYGDDHGGGVVVASGTLVLDDALIQGNRSFYDGGGAAVLYGAALVGHRDRFVGNVADELGGALNVRSGVAQLYASTFVANQARIGGGAVAGRRVRDIVNSTGSTLLFENCTFDEQRLTEADGVDFSAGGVIHIDATACRGDSEPDCEPTALTVRSSVFSRTYAGVNAAIFTADGEAAMDLSYNAFFDNGGRDSRHRWEEVAVRAPPMFVLDSGEPVDRDYHLREGSPLVDAGDPARTDPDGTRADIGAFGGAFAADVHAPDADGDGLPDAWERSVGMSPLRDDSAIDADSDRLDASEEYAASLDPLAADSDGDGVADGDELSAADDPRWSGDHAPWPAIHAPFLWIPDEPMVLDGAGSFDPDGDPLTWQWSVDAPVGSNGGVLTGVAGQVAELIPDVSGAWTVRLRLDSGGIWREATWTVQVTDAVVVPDMAPDLGPALATGRPVALRPGVWSGSLNVEDRGLVLFGLGEPDEVVLEGDVGATIRLADTGYVANPDQAPGGDAAHLAQLTLTGGAGTLGGGISCLGVDLRLDRVVVRDNEASCHGGGLFLDLCDTTATELIVTGNVASNPAPLDRIICKVPCIDNFLSASQGGGVFAACTNLTVDGGSFRLNDGSSNGGGVRFGNTLESFGEDNPVLTLRGVDFVANRADNGAALWMKPEEDPDRLSVIDGAVFADHADSNAVITVLSARASFQHLAVVRNQTDWLFDEGDRLANGVVVGTLATVAWLYLDLDSNLPVNGVFRQRAAQPATTMTVAPRFLHHPVGGDPLDYVFGLRPGSPLIDAGRGEPNEVDGSPYDVGVWSGPLAARAGRDAAWDVDGDGMSDGWERHFGLDVNVNDAGGDPDRDGRSNLTEYRDGTVP